MKKVLTAALIGFVILGFWVIFSRVFTLEDAKHLAGNLNAYTLTHAWIVFGILAAAQFVGMVFSLPSKGILTLLSGALLGTFFGSVATLSGAVAGTTVLFFVSRYLLRDRVNEKLGDKFQSIQARFTQNPIRAMIGLRLFITLPYGPITLVGALSAMRYRDFIVGTLIGDIPVVVVYCMAGKQLMALTTMSEAVSPYTIVAFVTIAALFIAAAFVRRERPPAPNGV